MADTAALETQLLAAIDAQGQLADSGEFAAAANVDHQVVVGLLKSLLASDMITTEVRAAAGAPQRAACRRCRRRQPRCRPVLTPLLHPPAAPGSVPQDIDHFRYKLTVEAEGYLGVGSPEVQVFNAVPADGITLADLKVGGVAPVLVMLGYADMLHRGALRCIACLPACLLCLLQEGVHAALSLGAAGPAVHPALPCVHLLAESDLSPRAPGLPAVVQKQLGAAGDVGFKQAMQQKWVAIDKSGGEVGQDSGCCSSREFVCT